MTQQDYSYPSVSQLGVASQPRIAMTTPLQPLGGIETIFVMHNDVNLIVVHDIVGLGYPPLLHIRGSGGFGVGATYLNCCPPGG